MAETLEQLAAMRCRPVEGDGGSISSERAAMLLGLLPGWALDGGAIGKRFDFANHYEAMAFANAVAWISHRQDHHPDMEVGFKTVSLRYSTHSVRGLSDNDFICAARVEMLMR